MSDESYDELKNITLMVATLTLLLVAAAFMVYLLLNFDTSQKWNSIWLAGFAVMMAALLWELRTLLKERGAGQG